MIMNEAVERQINSLHDKEQKLKVARIEYAQCVSIVEKASNAKVQKSNEITLLESALNQEYASLGKLLKDTK